MSSVIVSKIIAMIEQLPIGCFLPIDAAKGTASSWPGLLIRKRNIERPLNVRICRKPTSGAGHETDGFVPAFDIRNTMNDGKLGVTDLAL